MSTIDNDSRRTIRTGSWQFSSSTSTTIFRASFNTFARTAPLKIINTSLQLLHTLYCHLIRRLPEQSAEKTKASKELQQRTQGESGRRGSQPCSRLKMRHDYRSAETTTLNTIYHRKDFLDDRTKKLSCPPDKLLVGSAIFFRQLSVINSHCRLHTRHHRTLQQPQQQLIPPRSCGHSHESSCRAIRVAHCTAAAPWRV